MAESISLTVNGVKQTITWTGKESLLELLRDHLELTGVKEGCGYGVCGSCTVVVNGEATTSCTLRGKDKLEGGRSVNRFEASGISHPPEEQVGGEEDIPF